MTGSLISRCPAAGQETLWLGGFTNKLRGAWLLFQPIRKPRAPDVLLFQHLENGQEPYKNITDIQRGMA